MSIIGSIYRDTKIPELQYNIINFDHIGKALLTIFQCLTLEGWTDIMSNFQDSYNKYVAAIYFTALVLLCALLLINLIIAVLLENLHESQNMLGKSHDFEQIIIELTELGFPSSASIFMTDYELNIVSHAGHQGKSKKCLKAIGSLCRFPEPKYPQSSYFSSKFVRVIYRIINHPLFAVIIFGSIIMNTVILCLDYYDYNNNDDEGVLTPAKYFNYFFIAIFTVEVVLKMVGFGCREFVKDRFHLFDTLVVIISLAELLFSDGSGATSSLRAFRLFRIFKIFRVGSLRVMLDSLSRTVLSIGNYVILLLLFIYVFSLMGLQFFSGKLKFNEDGEVDLDNGIDRRYNFNTIFDTFLIIFNLLIGDNWNEVMYDTVRATSMISVFYFIIVILLVTLVMANLLIAIIISNFDMSRIYSTKRKMIEELKKYIDLGLTPFETAKKVFGKEVAKHIYYDEIKLIMEAEESQQQEIPNYEEDKSNEFDAQHLQFENKVAKRISENKPNDAHNRFMTVEEFKSEYGEADNDFEDKKSIDEDDNMEIEVIKRKGKEVNKIKDFKEFEGPANQQCGNAYDTDMKISNRDVLKFEELKDEPVQPQIRPKENKNININTPSVANEFTPREVRNVTLNHVKVKTRRESSFLKYVKCHSLLLFKDDLKLRLHLLRLITPTEDIISFEKYEKMMKNMKEKMKERTVKDKSEEVAVEVQDYSVLMIDNGKLVTTKQAIKYSKYFEIFIIFLILMSSMILCIDTPLNNPESAFTRTLTVIDFLFTFLFLTEAC